MKKVTFLRKMLWLLLIPFLATACEDKMDEHYKVPDWVKGSAWEVLESGEYGNYSMFLEAAEIAGLKPIMHGKTTVTVMAPDNDAFQAYLTKNNYTSVKDVPTAELKKLIGFHLVYYSYNTNDFINYRPSGSMETDEEKEVNAGLYYKHRTYSIDAPSYGVNSEGKQVMVYHLERFLPVFSYRFFQTRGLDAKSSYEYFYPESTWEGDNGFNVSNASVKEYGIIANNGYIHTVDRVIEPLETIYTELKDDSNYSMFLNLYDKWGTYVYDDELTKSYASTYGVDSIYQYKHSVELNGTSLPDIACEWPVSNYQAFTTLSSQSYTVFAPDNNALTAFFDKYWKEGGYASLEDVDDIIVSDFIKSYIVGSQMLFPQDIDKAKAEGTLDLQINTSDIKDRRLCVNGTLYGMSEMLPPTHYTSIVGPIYLRKDARPILYALSGLGLQSLLSSPEAKYTMILPSEEQLNESHIYTVHDTKTLTKDGDDGGTTPLSTSDKQNLLYINLASRTAAEGTTLPESGTKVIPTLASWNFWFVKDGKITTNALFNKQLNPEDNTTIWSAFTKLADQENGTVYTTDGEASYFYPDYFSSEMKETLANALAICADKRYVYYRFVTLMKTAGMIANETITDLTTSDRFIAFIPTNDAIQTALSANRIPGITNGAFDESGSLIADAVDKDALKSYLLSYFITNSNNALVNYPYVGSTMKSQAYNTLSTSYPAIDYTDDGSGLSVQLTGRSACHVIADYDCFPFAFKDGCFQLIDDAL